MNKLQIESIITDDLINNMKKRKERAVLNILKIFEEIRNKNSVTTTEITEYMEKAIQILEKART